MLDSQSPGSGCRLYGNTAWVSVLAITLVEFVDGVVKQFNLGKAVNLKSQC